MAFVPLIDLAQQMLAQPAVQQVAYEMVTDKNFRNEVVTNAVECAIVASPCGIGPAVAGLVGGAMLGVYKALKE